jgi:hypothetical protein
LIENLTALGVALEGGRPTRRCRRTGASVAALPLAPAAERQYRYAYWAVMVSRREVEALLSKLCVDLGLCLSPIEHHRLVSEPPEDVRTFTDAVFSAEGLAAAQLGVDRFRNASVAPLPLAFAAERQYRWTDMRDPKVEAAFERALSRFDGGNFDRLTRTEQILVTIWGLEADVNLR